MSRRLLVAFSVVFGLSLAVCGSAVPVVSAAPPSITNVSVQVVQTSDGTVSYRSVGSGRPLVLITGFATSQDAWSPAFVNALAKQHRVITFDNAGVGQTTMLPGTLTISAMADQTAALIVALHLRHPDILGWSEGGMIAQALAVRHSSDVRRLVLCATFSGDGKATVNTSTGTELFNAAVAGNITKLLSLMFPLISWPPRARLTRRRSLNIRASTCRRPRRTVPRSRQPTGGVKAKSKPATAVSRCPLSSGTGPTTW